MKPIRILLFLIAAAVLSLSCEKAQQEEPTDIVTSHDRALVIIPPEGSEMVYDIQSAYRYGQTLTTSPSLSAFYDYLFFFQEDDSAHPETRREYDGIVRSYLPGGRGPLVTIYGRYKLTETQIKYFFNEWRFEKTLPQRILISGLDESLGLGAELSIHLEDGEYKGTDDLIDFVKVNSYFQPTYYIEDNPFVPYHRNDSNINIYIRCKSGVIISFHYIAGTIPAYWLNR